MKRTLWAVAVLCILVDMGVPALGARRKLAKTPVAPKEEKPVAPEPLRPSTKIASFTDNIPALTTQLGLDEQQVGKLTALRKQSAEVLAKQEQVNQKRIEASQARIKRAKGTSAQRMTQELEKSTQRMQQALATLAGRHERTMFLVLTPAQKAKWNAPILQREVEKLFASVNLTDAQKAKIGPLCAAQARRLTMPVSPQTAGNTIKTLAGQVNQRVLTREQRKQYADKTRADRPEPRSSRK